MIPEDEQPATDLSQAQETIEDQADLDNQAAALLAAEGLLFTDWTKMCRRVFVVKRSVGLCVLVCVVVCV